MYFAKYRYFCTLQFCIRISGKYFLSCIVSSFWKRHTTKKFEIQNFTYSDWKCINMASGENKRPTKMAEEYTQRKPNISYLYSMIISQTWSPDKQTRQSDYRFPFFDASGRNILYSVFKRSSNGPIGVLKVLGCMILDLNLIILEAINHVLPYIGKNIARIYVPIRYQDYFVLNSIY